MDDSVKWIGKSWIKAHTTKLKLKYRGSPPRVWGKLLSSDALVIAIRITPTCVGKTLQCSHSRCHIQDHPHVCGENVQVSVYNRGGVRITPTCVGKTSRLSGMEIILIGSPPRVWGKLPFCYTICITNRITPTCVGKTKTTIEVDPEGEDHPHVCGEN